MKQAVAAVVLLLAGVSVGQQYSTTCPDMWVGWNNFCYFFGNVAPITWDNAQQECATRKAHLLRITTVDEFTFVRKTYDQYPADAYWTSLNDLRLNQPSNTTRGTNVFMWDNDAYPDDAIVKNNWDKEPDNTEREDCVQIDGQGALSVEDCANRHAYICQIAAISGGNCPPGNWWAASDSVTVCYSVSNVSDWQNTITWDQARKVCESWAPFTTDQTKKAQMLSITSSDTQIFLSNMLPTFGSSNPRQVFWTALNDKSNENYFVWAGNEATPFKESVIKWRQEPNNLGGKENCGALMAGGEWSDRNCDDKLNYICRMALPGAPQEWNMGCGQWTRAGQKCVFVYSSPQLNWQDARAFCQSQYGDLLKFDNEDDKMWLKIQAYTLFSQPAYWIGLNDKASENTFVWADGSEPPGDFLDWDKEPHNADQVTGGQEDCALMAYDGTFLDVACNRARAGTICEENVSACAAGWTASQGSCYLVDQRWRLKSEAINFCADQSSTKQGRLFDLNTQAEKDFLVAQISTLPVTIFWCDLMDSVLEGDWHWQHFDPNQDDTQIVQQLVNWAVEPNNWKEEDCVMVDVNGMLNDNQCTKTGGFICQRSLTAGAGSLWSVSAALLPLFSAVICRLM